MEEVRVTSLTSITLLSEQGGGTVNRPSVGSLDRALLIDGLTDHIHDTTKGTRAHGHTDSRATVLNHLPSHLLVIAVGNNVR